MKGSFNGLAIAGDGKMKSLFYLVAANLLFVLAASNVSGQAHGFLLLGSVSESFGEEGTIDSRLITTNLYDLQGRLLQAVTKSVSPDPVSYLNYQSMDYYIRGAIKRSSGLALLTL